MSQKNDIFVRIIAHSHGHDFFDRYLAPGDYYVYQFEDDKRQRYVWQRKDRCEVSLSEDCIYHLKVIEGRRLYGGRGITIDDVEILGEININKDRKLLQA